MSGKEKQQSLARQKSAQEEEDECLKPYARALAICLSFVILYYFSPDTMLLVRSSVLNASSIVFTTTSGLFASLMVRPPPPATSKLPTQSISTKYLTQEQEPVLVADTKTNIPEIISNVYDTNSAPAPLPAIDRIDISEFMHLLKLEEYADAISKLVSSLQVLERLPEKRLISLANSVEMTSAHADIFIEAIRERQIQSSTDTSDTPSPGQPATKDLREFSRHTPNVELLNTPSSALVHFPGPDGLTMCQPCNVGAYSCPNNGNRMDCENWCRSFPKCNGFFVIKNHCCPVTARPSFKRTLSGVKMSRRGVYYEAKSIDDFVARIPHRPTWSSWLLFDILGMHYLWWARWLIVCMFSAFCCYEYRQMRRFMYDSFKVIMHRNLTNFLAVFLAFILLRLVWVISWVFSAWLKSLHPVISVSFVALQIVLSFSSVPSKVPLCIFMLIAQTVVWVTMMFISDDFGASLRPDTA